ncbi:unnamed protein product [Acanthosepion pharaonis]|uniref:Uncharacterized protein n=1 Tax=Acanthosepion pharaonis TaxID=158019 RepID=A0A812B6B0_ACAPH|nr:unnamed protein product [Sepia pharaonis]
MTNNVSVGSLGKYPVLRDSAHIYPLSALHGPVSLPRNPYSPSLDTAPATTHKTETLNVATRRVEPCLSCIYYSSLVPEFRAVKILNINNQQVKEKVGRRTVEWSPLSPLPSPRFSLSFSLYLPPSLPPPEISPFKSFGYSHLHPLSITLNHLSLSLSLSLSLRHSFFSFYLTIFSLSLSHPSPSRYHFPSFFLYSPFLPLSSSLSSSNIIFLQVSSSLSFPSIILFLPLSLNIFSNLIFNFFIFPFYSNLLFCHHLNLKQQVFLNLSSFDPLLIK